MKKAVMLVMMLAIVLMCAFANGDSDSATAPEKYVLRLGHSLPIEHLNHKTALRFGELLKERTNGRVELEVYPAAQIGGEKENTDAVAMGTLDFALNGVGEIAKRFPKTLILDAPFIFRSREHLARVYKSDVFAEMMKEMEELTNITMISPGYYGTRHVTTSKAGIMTPANMKGIKLRTPDQPMYVGAAKALGATPTPMAFGEVYLALQQGVVDGQENPVATIEAMKFYEVQDYLVKTGHIIQGNHILGSTKVLNKLPEDIQKIIKEVGAEVSDWSIKESFRIEDELLGTLEMHGMTIVEPDLDSFVESAQLLHEEYESKWGEGLLESLRAVN